MTVAFSSLGGGERRSPNGRDIAPEKLGQQSHGRVHKLVGTAWIQVGAPPSYRRARVLRPIVVVAPEVKPLRYLVERPVERDLGHGDSIRVVEAALRCHLAQHF